MGAPSLQELLAAQPPSNWANMTSSVNSLRDYLAQQSALKQQLQIGQAQEYAKAQADVWAKMQDPLTQALEKARLAQGGFPMQMLGNMNTNIPTMADMLKGNPYAKYVTPQSMGSNMGQYNANTAPSSQGVSNQIISQGSQPVPIGGQASSVASFNPLAAGNPINGGLAQETVKMSPYGTQMPAEYTNIPAVNAVKEAGQYATDMGKAKGEAKIGTSRDVQQLGMVQGALKNLVSNYNDLNKAGAAGDIYRGFGMSHLGMLPKEMQGVVPEDIQNKSGQFISARNELITKMQPLLSQQFGAAGSSRIMESLLNMSKTEIGDLSTPKPQFEGQVEGTIKSLYRISKASQAYEQDLANSGQPAPDPDTAAREIFNRMQSQKLSPEEENSMQSIINDTLGRKGTNASLKAGGQFSQSQALATQTQAKQLDANTAKQILQAAGGDKNKARQMAKEQGYSF